MSIERRETKAGVTWRVRVHAGGRVVGDKTFTTKRAADTWERQQKEALGGGNFVSPQRSRLAVSVVAAEFLNARIGQVGAHSHRTDSDNIAALPSKFAARPIGSITDADVLRLLTTLLNGTDSQPARAHSTVSRMKTTFSALWTWAVRERYATTNVVRAVRMPSGAVQAAANDYFTPDTTEAVLAAQRERSAHGALITEFLSLTGLRWGELRAARVSSLRDLPFPALFISRSHSDGYGEKSTKNRERRSVPLVDRAHAIARGWAAGKLPGDYLATSATGLQVRGNYFRRSVAWTTTASGYTVHDLRHFAASMWLRNGVPINQVAVWLGDDPRTVLKVYAHVLGEAQDAEALRRLNSLPSHSPDAGTQTTQWKEVGRQEADETASSQGFFGGDGGI